MIQDIFLPEKIGSYYIFRQRVLGIDITKTQINGSLVIARGSTITIEKHLSLPLNGEHNGAEQNGQEDRMVATLAALCEQMGPFDQLNTALSSGVVVFKELRLPFTTRDKISMVIHFEVAPLLPFSPNEAVIDFIITHVNEEEKSAQVLVAAAQKKHISEHLALFEKAGYQPNNITVDMFALYGLYTQIPTYQSVTGSLALIDLNVHSTNIITIVDGQLRIIRTLGYGLATVAKDAGTSADLKPQQVMDHLLRFGLEQGGSEGNNQAIKNSLTAFFNKLQFALTSTFNQLQKSSIEKIVLCGPGAEIKDIASFAQEQLGAPCELFDIKKITENKQYQIASQLTLSQPVVLSTAIALATPAVQDFNLLKGDFAPATQMLLVKQLITASVLTIILFGLVISQTIIQGRRLRSEINASQEQAIEALQERFPEMPEEEDDLDEVISLAKAELEKEEVVWRAFSSQNRASFLEYLLELTSKINKQELGFIPQQLSIVDGTQGEITLKAKVKDYAALKKLEQALRESKLFSYVEGQSNTEFAMKIIATRNV
jgi:type IV pilus assembly protein PilM